MRPLRLPFRRDLAYGVFCVLDHGCWLLIQLLPAPTLMALARHRPWQRLQRPLPPDRQQLWKVHIAGILKSRSRRAGMGSSCLSRSLSGRLLFDLIGVPNELHLGINQLLDGRKVPHAWLSDPNSGRRYTPGLAHGAGAALISF